MLVALVAGQSASPVPGTVDTTIAAVVFIAGLLLIQLAKPILEHFVARLPSAYRPNNGNAHTPSARRCPILGDDTAAEIRLAARQVAAAVGELVDGQREANELARDLHRDLREQRGQLDRIERQGE